jgi:hypothetical protein
MAIRPLSTHACPYEFRHRPGKPPTIRLRYSTSDPADPFRQSNYMSAGEFLLVLGLGGVAATFGVLWPARAGRIAGNAVRRRPQGASDGQHTIFRPGQGGEGRPVNVSLIHCQLAPDNTRISCTS